MTHLFEVTLLSVSGDEELEYVEAETIEDVLNDFLHDYPANRILAIERKVLVSRHIFAKVG